MVKSLAIVAEEYESNKYRVSHIKDATHLLVYLEEAGGFLTYEMPSQIKKSERPGPAMSRYLEAILKENKTERVDVLATITEIQTPGPWKDNDVYKEGPDVVEVARNYLDLKEMKRELYKDDI